MHVMDGNRLTINYYLHPKATIGINVSMSPGAYISEAVTLGDNVFVGPNVVFVDSSFDQSKLERTKVSKNTIIGGGSTIYPGVIIGENVIVKPGSVVTENIPSNVEVSGNPAKITSHLFQRSRNLKPLASANVDGIKEYSFTNIVDLRGNLTIAEFDENLPFVPKRLFFISGVPSEKIRGEHAHKLCQQLLILALGSLSIAVEDGKNQQIINMNKVGQAIYIPSMVWASQYNFRSDALLLVLASDHYDESDYIRSYDDYLMIKCG